MTKNKVAPFYLGHGVHTYIHKFITRNIVKQSSNQRRGQAFSLVGVLDFGPVHPFL